MQTDHDNHILDDYKILDSVESASITYICLIVLLSLTTSYAYDHPTTIISMLVIQTVLFLYRFLIFNKISNAGRSSKTYNRLRHMAAFGFYSAALIWSVFCMVTYTYYGTGLPTIITILGTIAITSCAAFTFSEMFEKARAYIMLLILPFSLWCCILGGSNGLIISALSLIYLLLLLKNLENFRQLFVARKNAIQHLNNQATSLSEVNRKLMSEIQFRKSTEQKLRKSEDRYRTLFENNPIATIIVDHNARITGLNYARKRTMGRLPKLGEIMYKEYGSRHQNDMHEELIDSMRTGLNKEFPDQEYDGRFLYIKISPFSGGAIITSLDITEQKIAEKHIHKLTREIMTVQEKERKRISRDLHDSVAQELSTLRISCETFFDDLPSRNVTSIHSKINNISQILHGSIQTVRDIAYELRPPCLDEFGLGTTIFRYCEDFTSRTGISSDFFSAGIDKLMLEPEVEINLYRLIQEALGNVIKHSHATHVVVKLVASHPNIILRIDDNGRGFEKELQEKALKHGKNMGLKGMEERVLLFNGKFKIQTRPGQGTRLLFEIPVQEASKSTQMPEQPASISS